ncbi:MAG: family 43 glycosylhydrolase [Terriglobales bacterium]
MIRLKSVARACVLWAAALPIIAIAQAPRPLTVTISNVEPRRDAADNILDVHDGALEVFEGRFYLYGTRYGDTDGLDNRNQYVCYSSPDLVHWQFEGLLLKDAPRRTYYRPYVKFNRSTGKYVLWYNADNRYGVATADRPAGPFTIQNPNVGVKYSAQGVGDFGLFVDDDGTGYIAYTALNLPQVKGTASPSPQHHRISVERLAPDYLSSTQENSGFVAGNVESPSLFKRNATYYLLFDNTCAFCPNGSGARVYTAANALGPYLYRSNINLKNAKEAGTSWTTPGSGRNDAILGAQQTHVAQIPSASGTLFVWMGDRWGSTPDGLKGHDFQVWAPLEFGDDGVIRPLKKLDTWRLTLSLPPQTSQRVGERSGNSP